jgi:radical SAM protein (TIGR01212 family)
MKTKPYRDYNSYLREVFGCRVQKITVDAGLSCPNRDGTRGWGGCIYCNPRGSGTGAAGLGQDVTTQLETAKAILARRYKARKFLAYFQSFSNTYAPLARLRELYEQALSVPDIVGLTIGTRPDCVPEETLDMLAHLAQTHHIWLEYGLQSAHDETLERIHRGHDVATFVDALERTRRRNLPVCVHVILGLPGENRETMLTTARFVAAHDIQAVKIHLLYVIKGTLLARWYANGAFKCLTRQEYVSLVAEFLALLPPEMIVQRLTGDPHPHELVAPEWALEKQQNLQAIHAYMRKQELYQGKACPKSVQRP